MSPIKFFGRNVPAWVLLAVILVAGAGVATTAAMDGLDDTSSVSVSQSLRVGTPVSNPMSGADAFIGKVNSDGTAFSVYIEANNGDRIVYDLPIYYDSNLSLIDIVMEVPEGITADVEGDEGTTVVQTGMTTWVVDPSDDGEAILTFFLKISPTTVGVFEFNTELTVAEL